MVGAEEPRDLRGRCRVVQQRPGAQVDGARVVEHHLRHGAARVGITGVKDHALTGADLDHGGADLAGLGGLAQEMYERCAPPGDQDDGFDNRWFQLGVTFQGAGRAALAYDSDGIPGSP